MVDQYIVTGYVKRICKRDNISKPMNKRKANAFMASLKSDMKMAIPEYKWVNQIAVKKIR